MTKKSRDDVLLELLTENLRLTRILLDRRVTDEATPDTVAEDFAPVEQEDAQEPVKSTTTYRREMGATRARRVLNMTADDWENVRPAYRSTKVRTALPYLSPAEGAKLITTAVKRIDFSTGDAFETLGGERIQSIKRILTADYGWKEANGNPYRIADPSLSESLGKARDKAYEKYLAGLARAEGETVQGVEPEQPVEQEAVPEPTAEEQAVEAPAEAEPEAEAKPVEEESDEEDAEEERFNTMREQALRLFDLDPFCWRKKSSAEKVRLMQASTPYLSDAEVAQLVCTLNKRVSARPSPLWDGLSDCRYEAILKLMRTKHNWFLTRSGQSITPIEVSAR